MSTVTEQTELRPLLKNPREPLLWCGVLKQGLKTIFIYFHSQDFLNQEQLNKWSTYWEQRVY